MPDVLLYLVSAAHWEAALLAVLLLGVLCWRRAHPSIALLLIISAGGIKAPVLLALPVLVIARALAAVAGRTRVGTVARDVLVAALGLCVISLLLPDGLGWLAALGTPARIATMATPAVAAADTVRATAGWFDAPTAAGGLIGMSRAAFAAGGLLGGAWVLATMRRRDPLRTIGFLLLLTAVCGPVLHAWYLLWGLAALVPAAAGGAVRTRTLLLLGCGTYTFTELPSARGTLPPRLVISLAVVCVVTAAAVTAGGALATWRDRPGLATLPSSPFRAPHVTASGPPPPAATSPPHRPFTQYPKSLLLRQPNVGVPAEPRIRSDLHPRVAPVWVRDTEPGRRQMRGGGAREHAETPSGQQPADRMLARPTPPADTLRTASGTSSLGLPDVGGWCCAGRRRAVIVVLTARTAEFKVAVALNAGADG